MKCGEVCNEKNERKLSERPTEKERKKEKERERERVRVRERDNRCAVSVHPMNENR